MNMSRYLLVHKDHPLRVSGINAGAEMATLHLARFLAKSGTKVVVAAQLVEGETTHGGVEFWDLGEEYNVKGALERMRSYGDYHLISAGRAQPFYFVQDDPHCLSKILISHDRSGNDTGINPKALCHYVDRVVCVSDAQRQVFIEAGAPAEKVRTIRNGVDLELFSEGEIAKRDWRKLVFVGALVPDKGLDLLLVSYAELKAKYADLTLDVYGSADLWGRTEVYDVADLEARIPGLKFHGSVPQAEVAKAFQTAGICVVPSIWFDPFPLTSLEAQVSGCPVVTFNIGGLPEGVVHRKTGLVVDKIEPESLSVALDSLLGDSQRLQTMSQEAARTQRQHFTWERVVEELRDLQEIIGDENHNTKSEWNLPERFGFMTTWNQQCGLSTYAKMLSRQWRPGSFQVFSEYVIGPNAGKPQVLDDEPFVQRCFSWNNDQWNNFIETVSRSGIETLLINAHNPKQLSDCGFQRAIVALKEKGISTALLLHTIFTKRVDAIPVLTSVDHVIVHTDEMALEVASYGVSLEKVSTIPHGVEVLPPLSGEDKQKALQRLSLPENVPVIATVGFIQPHKGIESLIQAVRTLQDEQIDVHACIAGTIKAEDSEAEQYYAKLQTMAEHFGVRERITFLNRFLSEEEVSELLQSASVVVMNYRSDHYECSGACSRALGAGASVITSLAPAFHSFGPAVWHASEGFSVALAIREILHNQEVQHFLSASREQFLAKTNWSVIAPKFISVLKQFQTHKKKEHAVAPLNQLSTSVVNSDSLRVLLQNRSNMFTQRGGDTIVVEQLVEGLRKRGISVDVDVDGAADPANYDLVHLINFALPQMIEHYGQRAMQAGTPFVVTTLCEDIPNFHNQSIALAETLMGYVAKGQDRQWLSAQKELIAGTSPCAPFQNEWAAKNASRLIANGAGEQRVLEKTYREHAQVSIVPVGYDLKDNADRELFVREYGVEDFILCVGRLESRKNQLMLQVALEDLDIPVVYAAGGFSYQPQYAEAVKAFRRKGKTIVLDRISSEMLASAYRAAKVHALPSWYELPGLVSLEAAMLGCNVVGAASGTTKDYLGDFGFYCEPDSADSIRNAVLAAYYSPYREGVADRLREFSWDGATEKTIAVYGEVLGRTIIAGQARNVTEVNVAEQIAPSQSLHSGPSFEELAAKGYAAAQERKFNMAHQFLAEAEQLNPRGLRVLCNRAAVFLAEEKLQEAKDYFAKARSVDASDVKAQSGYAMCLMMEGNKADAYTHFLEILDREPTDMIATLQLLDCSYALGRYEDLERVLKKILELQPENFDMRYCLTGCLVRAQKLDEALAQVNILLEEKPQHGGSIELKQAIEEMIQQQATIAPQVDQNPIERAIERVVEEHVAAKPFQSFDSIDVRIGELEELKHRKNLDEAMEGVDELLRRKDLSEPQRTSSELLRGEILALLGERDEAKAIFQVHYEKDPNSPRALCGLAAIAASYNELDSATALFQKALDNAPLYDKALAGMGFCDFYRQQYDSSWNFYSKSLNVNPENLSALLGCIQLGYKLKRLPELEERLEQYLDMHPADLDMVYAYAGCLYAQNRLDEALSEVQKILIFKSDDKRATELRGVIEDKLGSSGVAAQ
ncbi:MAG: glycosyltransferase [Bdellovibrionales bacterium]|nr:glycosyltransferase [Bdellovibrionales bacterium]